jgi:hypothetical protein
MIEYRKESWEVLCEQAASEQDPKRFRELLREIDQALALRRALRASRPTASMSNPFPPFSAT